MRKAITKIIFCVIVLGATMSVSAATKTEVPVDNSNPPILAGQLPYAPSFIPTSGDASVTQRYTLHDWSYQVQYDYGDQAGRWLVSAYSAQRLRFSDGELVPLTRGSSPNTEAGIAPQGLPVCPQPQVISGNTNTPDSLQVESAGCPTKPPSTTPPDPTPPPPFPGNVDGEQNTVTVSPGDGWTETTTYTWSSSGPPNGGTWGLTYFKATKCGAQGC